MSRVVGVQRCPTFAQLLATLSPLLRVDSLPEGVAEGIRTVPLARILEHYHDYIHVILRYYVSFIAVLRIFIIICSGSNGELYHRECTWSANE